MTLHHDQPTPGAQTHALYRFYAGGGVLLYVGITLNPGGRWRAHARGKPWWHEVATVTIEPQPSRTAALDAEQQAIHAEHPRYNVTHNRPRPALPTKVTLGDLDPFLAFWGRQAADMPDDCHDVCVERGILSVYYPHLWHDGIAHYTCEHGHRWTCSWGHNYTGAAGANRGKVQERYQAVEL